MFSFLDRLADGFGLIITIACLAFWLWMLIDAIMREEWIWAIFIFFFQLSAVLYFFLVYRAHRAAVGGAGFQFEIPGAADRKRIQELQGQIHHLDKAHHHMELGDIYFRQGKWEEAEKCYQAACERDPEDLDIRARMGVLYRHRKPQEARKYLEDVCREEPDHDYGATLMALAETLAELGETDAAKATWEKVLERHSYSRARVQLAELSFKNGDSDRAIGLVKEVLDDFKHTPKFARKKEREWIQRAKKLLHQIPV